MTRVDDRNLKMGRLMSCNLQPRGKAHKRSQCAAALATAPRRAGAVLALAAVHLAVSGACWAAKLPEAGDVLVGEVNVSQPDTSTMVLKQRSNHAAMSWRSFSVRDNAVLHIEQPSNASLLINRVTGSQPSIISGEIRSTGIVMLVNPNGITITPEAELRGSAFLVSNKDMPDAELEEPKWRGLPRLLRVAAASAVNLDVRVRAKSSGVAAVQDTLVANCGGLYDVEVLSDGRIIASHKSGAAQVSANSPIERAAFESTATTSEKQAPYTWNDLTRDVAKHATMTEPTAASLVETTTAAQYASAPYYDWLPSSTEHGPSVVAVAKPIMAAPIEQFVPTTAPTISSTAMPTALSTALQSTRPVYNRAEHPFHVFGMCVHKRSISQLAASWAVRGLHRFR